MKEKKHVLALAFSAGALFSLGLTVGGMTQPDNVLAFLDVAGQWDPSLALVMAFAIATHAPLQLAITKHSLGTPIQCAVPPTERQAIPAKVDRSLVLGAALFGTGWGLAGYCPGPALASLGTLSVSGALFVAALLMGMLLHSAQTRIIVSRTVPQHSKPSDGLAHKFAP